MDAGLAGALGKRLEMLDFSARGGGVVVVADARGLRRSHYQRVVGVKQDEIGAEFHGLREREVEGLLVGGISEAKRMVEGLLQPGLRWPWGTSFECLKILGCFQSAISAMGHTSK